MKNVGDKSENFFDDLRVKGAARQNQTFMADTEFVNIFANPWTVPTFTP